MGFFKKLDKMRYKLTKATFGEKIAKESEKGDIVKKMLNPDPVKPADLRGMDISKETAQALKDQSSLRERTKAASEAGAARADVIKQMGEAAMGRGPSLADVQLKQAQDRNLSQMLAMAQQQKSAVPATTQRTLLLGQQAAGRDLAQQAASNRLAERGNFLSAVQNADIGLRQDIGDIYNYQLANKGAQQKMAAIRAQEAAQNAANKQAGYSTIGQIGGTVLGGIFGGPAGAQLGGMAGGALGGAFAGGAPQGSQFGGGGGMDIGSLMGQVSQFGQSKMTPQAATPPTQIATSASQGASSFNPKYGPALYSGNDMLSDQNTKENIKPASSDISKFLDAVSAKQYRYKDQEEGPDHFGIIAQALEKSKVGKSMVEDTPEGKVINKDRALAALLASQAELNKRIKKVERS
jgi:Chaperone of endosialidase